MTGLHKKKIALVLSGGGIKAAAFHIGVCLALQEKGFRFSGGKKGAVTTPEDESKPTIQTYVGSSAGALVSALLASGVSVNALIDAFLAGSRIQPRRKKTEDSNQSMKPLTYWDIFSVSRKSLVGYIPALLKRQSLFSGGIESLVKNGFKLNGLFSTSGLEKYLRSSVLPTNSFSDLAANLYIVATQLNQSRKYVFGDFDETRVENDTVFANFSTISEAAAASASLPPVFVPYGIEDDKGETTYFFDGEIRDTLSSHVAADTGSDLVISSYSIQPYRYKKKTGSLHDKGIPVILNQALYQVVEQKIIREIEHQTELKAVYDTINGYLRQIDFPEEHRDRLLNIVLQKTRLRPDVDYMYVHPNPEDYEMFFADHFSLNPKILGKIVRIGFRSAIRVLRKHDI